MSEKLPVSVIVFPVGAVTDRDAADAATRVGRILTAVGREADAIWVGQRNRPQKGTDLAEGRTRLEEIEAALVPLAKQTVEIGELVTRLARAGEALSGRDEAEARNARAEELRKEVKAHRALREAAREAAEKSQRELDLATALSVPGIFRFTEPIIEKRISHWIRKFDECWIPDNHGELSLTRKMTPSGNASLKTKYIGWLSRFHNVLPAGVMAINTYDIIAVVSGPEPQSAIFLNRIRDALLQTNYKSLIINGHTNATSDIKQLGQCLFETGHVVTNRAIKTATVLGRSWVLYPYWVRWNILP